VRCTCNEQPCAVFVYIVIRLREEKMMPSPRELEIKEKLTSFEIQGSVLCVEAKV